MASSQHRISRRVSTHRIGIGSPPQLLILVTASLLYLEMAVALNYDSSAQELDISKKSVIPVNIHHSTIIPTLTPLYYSMYSKVAVTSSAQTEGIVEASESQKANFRTRQCFQNDAKVVKYMPVIRDCHSLLLNFNITENIPHEEKDLLSKTFTKGNLSLSVGNVSSIISEDYMCKCWAGKHTVTDDTCVLSVNFNESPQQSQGFESLLSLTGPSLVKALSLRNNNIDLDMFKPMDMFKHFVNLKVLDLSQNMLISLNLTQAKLPFLIKLKLSRNKIQWIDISPNNVTTLYIHYNNINDLSFISKFKNLGVLDASHNSIASIPSCITNLTELACIYLNNNNIKNVDILQDMSLKYVYRISLSHNKIQEVWINFSDDLLILELQNNNISHFNFAGVTKMEYLDLCNNRISKINQTHPLRDSHMTFFKLCNNTLSDASVIMLMPDLVTLYLSYNNLQNVDKMFMNKRHLKNLFLLNVTLDTLEFVKNLSKLEILKVDGNNITKFPKELFHGPIKRFTLSNNPLKPVYCPRNENGIKIMGDCNMSFDERDDNIIFDISVKNKDVNKNMECILKSSSGKEFLNQCSSVSGARKEPLKHLLVAVIFVLNVL